MSNNVIYPDRFIVQRLHSARDAKARLMMDMRAKMDFLYTLKKDLMEIEGDIVYLEAKLKRTKELPLGDLPGDSA